MVKKIFLLFLHFFLALNTSYSQSVDYKAIFGEDWNKAENYVNENRSWMEPVLARNHISYPLAIAVIFPELVRYSALRDKMEITLLKALYVNLGQDYSNFSIGRLQMKPSFAEIIREQAPSALGHRSRIIFKSRSEYDDIKNFRKSIVIDLEDPKTQFNYLVAFLKLCEKKYRLNTIDEITLLKFTATAYNYGIDKSAVQIENMIDKKFFNIKLLKTENYCYQDVSLYWYKMFTEEQP